MLRVTVDVSIFSQRCFGQGFAYTEVPIFPLTGGLISWAPDYMVLVASGMMKVNDLWQYEKGFKHFIPFITVHAYIMCAFKIHCTKQRCELPPAAFWMGFLSSSCWKDLIKLQQLSTTLTKDKRVTSLGFIFWNEKKKSDKKVFQLKDNKKMSPLPEFPANLGWKGTVFYKILPLLLLPSHPHPFWRGTIALQSKKPEATF